MRIRAIVRYSILVWVATILINAHLLGMMLLQWGGCRRSEIGMELRAILSGAWFSGWLHAWEHVLQNIPFFLPLQIILLILGLGIWLWRPSLLTATVLALLGMCAGPVGGYVFGYPQFSIPIASLVFLAGFLLHCIWRKHTASRSVPRP